MTKYTQKQLKEMIQLGIATDITYGDIERRREIEIVEQYYTQVGYAGYASGTYGCSGKLLQGHNTGKLYAITGRTSALYVF